MTFRKHVMIGVAALCVSALLFGCSSEDTVAPAPVNEAPPVVVSGLSATLTSDGNVALRWDASAQPNVRGYNVYRHVASEYAIGKLNVDPIAQNRYIDSNVDQGLVYEYAVTAVTVRGQESGYAMISINTEARKNNHTDRKTR